jgi:hypothetical protein
MPTQTPHMTTTLPSMSPVPPQWWMKRMTL